jgi:hypothetical protein
LTTWEARQVKHLTPVEYTTPRAAMLATAEVLIGELEKRNVIKLLTPSERQAA